MARGNVGSMDFNTITEAGIYHIYNASGNNKPENTQYALLVVYNDMNGYITQLVVNISSASLYIRSRNEVDEWFNWRII